MNQALLELGFLELGLCGKRAFPGLQRFAFPGHTDEPGELRRRPLRPELDELRARESNLALEPADGLDVDGACGHVFSNTSKNPGRSTTPSPLGTHWTVAPLGDSKISASRRLVVRTYGPRFRNVVRGPSPSLIPRRRTAACASGARDRPAERAAALSERKRRRESGTGGRNAHGGQWNAVSRTFPSREIGRSTGPHPGTGVGPVHLPARAQTGEGRSPRQRAPRPGLGASERGRSEAFERGGNIRHRLGREPQVFRVIHQ